MIKKMAYLLISLLVVNTGNLIGKTDMVVITDKIAEPTLSRSLMNDCLFGFALGGTVASAGIIFMSLARRFFTDEQIRDYLDSTVYACGFIWTLADIFSGKKRKIKIKFPLIPVFYPYFGYYYVQEYYW